MLADDLAVLIQEEQVRVAGRAMVPTATNAAVVARVEAGDPLPGERAQVPGRPSGARGSPRRRPLRRRLPPHAATRPPSSAEGRPRQSKTLERMYAGQSSTPELPVHVRSSLDWLVVGRSGVRLVPFSVSVSVKARSSAYHRERPC